MLGKLLKFSHPLPGWKKIINNTDSEESKRAKKLHGLKKLIPKMGNFSSSHRQQQLIENVDEHSTRLMTSFTELRENEIGCDLVFHGTSCKSAHKIIVSYNPILLEVASTSSKSVAVVIEDNLLPQSGSVEDIEKADGIESPKLSSSSRIASSETVNEQESSKEKDLVSELKTTDIAARLKEDEKDEKSLETEKGDSSNIENDTFIDVDREIECKVESTEDLSPPLFSEIAIAVDVEENQPNDQGEIENPITVPTTNEIGIEMENLTDSHSDSTKVSPGVKDAVNQTEQKIPVEEGADSSEFQDVDLNPTFSLDDPVDILITFLYTSHIDITQKNVLRLRLLAVQCAMDDVITACDEFSKVLFEETEHMTTDKEKSEVESKFRYRYSDPSMPTKILQHLDDLRKRNQFVDLTLESVPNRFRFSVHSLVVSSLSQFFEPVIETESVPDELQITEFHECMLESIISFFYTGKVEVNQLNAENLIQAADRLELKDVVEGCSEYFESITSVQNCIQHRAIAIDYKCTKLKDFVDGFIAVHFLAVSNTPDFMILSAESLIEIASNDNLNLHFPSANGEMAVFDAVKKWLLHDEENRKRHLVEVMGAVRFPLISSKNLIHDVSTDLLIMSCPEICRRITDIITSAPLMSYSEPVTMRGEECILIAGGSYPVEDETSEEQGYGAVNYSSLFTLYDPKTSRFHEIAKLPETRALHCVIACDQFVFVVGGFDPHSCIVNSVYSFDLAAGTWSTMPNMKIKRSCFSLHSVSGYLYAVGGLTPKGYTATVEKLDRKRKVWSFASPLPMSRYRHAGCVINDAILVSGGNEKMDLVLSYDPKSDSWKKEMPLNVGRNSHAMSAINDSAYAFGGEEIPFSAECFKNKTWTMLPNPLFDFPSLYFPGCVALNNQIYLCGGWENQDDPAYFTKYFDTAKGLWVSLRHHMPCPRGSVGSCAVRIPKNYWKAKF